MVYLGRHSVSIFRAFLTLIFKWKNREGPCTAMVFSFPEHSLEAHKWFACFRAGAGQVHCLKLGTDSRAGQELVAEN